MNYACVSNGQVVNVIVADPEFVAEYEHNYESVIPSGEGVTIGWTWNETDGFQAPPTPAPVETPPATS